MAVDRFAALVASLAAGKFADVMDQMMGMAPVFQADTPSAAHGRLEGHPLTGESAFYESNVYLGFWRENPQVFAAQFDAQDSVLAGLQRQQGGAGGPSAADVAQLARFRPPEKCWFGMTCRNKNTCSRSHGDQPEHLRNCACDNQQCPLGHPLRANRGAPGPSGKFQGGTITGKRPGEHYVCNKCGLRNDHYLNECPEATCHKCGGKGHIASNCPNTQGQFNGGGGRPPPRDGGGGAAGAAASGASAATGASRASSSGAEICASASRILRATADDSRRDDRPKARAAASASGASERSAASAAKVGGGGARGGASMDRRRFAARAATASSDGSKGEPGASSSRSRFQAGCRGSGGGRERLRPSTE